MSLSSWIEKPSPHSVSETLDRLEAALLADGWKVMARVDHSGHATKAGLDLRPTQVLLFGNPALGTRVMQAEQTLAIDLPSKALAWQDATGQVRLGYRDLRALTAGRPELAPAQAAIAQLTDGIDRATDAAVAGP